jgi:glycyl-tRNA synthetase
MTARYSRNDELGTVDFQSVKDGTITLRDRDTMSQVRAGQDEICGGHFAAHKGYRNLEPNLNVAAKV